MKDEPPSDQMVRDLVDAGWRCGFGPIFSPIRWISPWGAYFLGTYGAWRVMRLGKP